MSEALPTEEASDTHQNIQGLLNRLRGSYQDSPGIWILKDVSLSTPTFFAMGDLRGDLQVRFESEKTRMLLTASNGTMRPFLDFEFTPPDWQQYSKKPGCLNVRFGYTQKRFGGFHERYYDEMEGQSTDEAVAEDLLLVLKNAADISHPEFFRDSSRGEIEY